MLRYVAVTIQVRWELQSCRTKCPSNS